MCRSTSVRASAAKLLLTTLFVFAFLSPAYGQTSLPKLSPEQLDTLLKSPDQPTLVVVMASWCGPCVEELPRINDFYNEYRDTGVGVVGLSLDFNPAAMERLLTNQPVDFPFYWLGEKGISLLNAVNVPLLLVLQKGKPVKRLQGALNKAQLRTLFDALSSKQ